MMGKKRALERENARIRERFEPKGKVDRPAQPAHAAASSM